MTYHLREKKKKKVRFQNLPNARWMKCLNIGEEFIKIAEENLDKYLNNLQSINVCFFKKKTKLETIKRFHYIKISHWQKIKRQVTNWENIL